MGLYSPVMQDVLDFLWLVGTSEKGGRPLAESVNHRGKNSLAKTHFGF